MITILNNLPLVLGIIIIILLLLMVLVIRFQRNRIKSQEKLISELNIAINYHKRSTAIAKKINEDIKNIKENYEAVKSENKKVILNAYTKNNIDLISNRLNKLLQNENNSNKTD